MIFTRKPNFIPNSPQIYPKFTPNSPQIHPNPNFNPTQGLGLPLDRIFELFVKTIIYMPVANFFFVHEIF